MHRHLSGHVSLQGFTTTLYHDVFSGDHPSSSHSLSPNKTPLLSNHVIDLKFLTYFGASEKRPLEHEGLGMVAATYRPERVSALSHYKGKSDPLLRVIAAANTSFDHGQEYQRYRKSKIFPVHGPKAYSRSRGTAPLFLIPGTGWTKWSASRPGRFTPGDPLNWRLKNIQVVWKIYLGKMQLGVL